MLTHLGALNFDPEFYNEFESHVIAEYNKNNPNVQLETKKGLVSKIMNLLEAH